MKTLDFWIGIYWMKVKIEFKLQDFWIGIYWKSVINEMRSINSFNCDEKVTDIWICLIPCFPIHIIKTKYLL